MSREEEHPDYFRLGKDLRAMNLDFKKVADYRKPDPIIADDVPLEEGNLLTSRFKYGRERNEGKGMHRIILDIDYDAALIPSTTPGHYHLILDVPLDWPEYEEFLKAAARAGVIEPGYASAAIKKGYTGIRAPWEKKEKRDVRQLTWGGDW